MAAFSCCRCSGMLPVVATALAILALAIPAAAGTPSAELGNPYRVTNFQTSGEPAEPSPSDTHEDHAPFKPIAATGIDIALPPGGDVPQPQPPRHQLATPTAAAQLGRPWPSLTYTWAAAATRHNPLYFEEINAERYGYTCSRVLQPAISTAHFFGTIPALPYLHGANCPWECQYTLGHYRPGSCNPWRRHCWPLSARGALYQAGVVTGVTYVLP